ncbi:hypothetical protein VNI00_004244 [Paramarasmius palmivorus]|uniref:F-box domain-containing protein n=1 Tax=Paramarasmius palmivorus TaxID=297713 RepID=A0AAW0DPT8_9AGAR
MPTSFIPHEIVEQIITDAIPPDWDYPRQLRVQRKQILKSFSLVSHSWLEVSRKHLFTPDSSLAIPKTLDALEHLKSLCFAPFTTLHMVTVYRLVTRQYNSVVSEAFFEALAGFKMFATVHQIIIWSGVWHMPMPIMSERVLFLLAKNFPDVLRLDIRNICFPSPIVFAKFIGSFPKLRWLTCLELQPAAKPGMRTFEQRFMPPIPVPPRDPKPIVHLQSLTLLIIDFHSHLDLEFIRYISFGDRLRSLTFHGDMRRRNYVQEDFVLAYVVKMIGIMGRHLRRLSLSLDPRMGRGEMSQESIVIAD